VSTEIGKRILHILILFHRDDSTLSLASPLIATPLAQGHYIPGFHLKSNLFRPTIDLALHTPGHSSSHLRSLCTMIRFEGMAPEVMAAMCTPMHQILPIHYPTPTSPAIPSVNPVLPSTIAPGSLFLGSMSATMDRELLASKRITHIVQVVDVPWLPVSEKDGFRCLKIDLLDKPSADLQPHLEGACQYITHALISGGNVLVHCQQVCSLQRECCHDSETCLQGVSRSPAIVIAYLIHNLGMSYDQAHALVKWCRPCINPNPGFVAALRAWESRWRSTATASLGPQFRRANTSYAGLTSADPATSLAPTPPGYSQIMRGTSYTGNSGARPC